ncbi:MAG: sensor domain-containing diguanylate cyclase [Alphaproteobacteria bacterium]|nr:sensor domain-containing diguanylate cyclase [Alphaproteobacteria bacterium]
MLAPSLPLNISDHPHGLRTFNILENFLYDKFERIKRLAMNLFEVPHVSVSLIDEQCQLNKSFIGAEVIEAPYEISFCEHAILQDDIFFIPDTLLNEQFCKSPYVLGTPHIRFYAAFPIWINHQKVGIISLVDHKPRYFSPDQLFLLKDIAGLIETEIQNYTISTDKGKLASDLDQARMASMIDSLTGLWNRQGMYNILKSRMDEYQKIGAPFTVAILDIDNFKNINDTYGHDSGDHTLMTIAKTLIASCRETDGVCRWGGEEFLLLINESNLMHVTEIAERIRLTLESAVVFIGAHYPLKITVTIGLSCISENSHPTLEDLISKADQALYQGKRSGKNKVVLI